MHGEVKLTVRYVGWHCSTITGTRSLGTDTTMHQVKMFGLARVIKKRIESKQMIK
jgi:hypothetical protein